MQKVDCRKSHKTNRMGQLTFLKGCSSTSKYHFRRPKRLCLRPSVLFPHVPETNTLLYLYYLCKQCAFFFISAQCESCCAQLRCGHRSRSSSVYSRLRRCVSGATHSSVWWRRVFFGLFWERQPSCFTQQIEKGKKSKRLNDWERKGQFSK